MTEREFNKIYKEQHKGLVFFAIKLIHNTEDAENIVADAFVSLLEQKEHPTPIRFLITTIRFDCLDYIKHSKRKAVFYSFIEELSPTFVDTIETKSHLLNLILNEIESLPTQQKKIANLLKLEFTQVEIAEILHLKPSTIAVQIMRIREKLKLKLKIV